MSTVLEKLETRGLVEEPEVLEFLEMHEAYEGRAVPEPSVESDLEEPSGTVRRMSANCSRCSDVANGGSLEVAWPVHRPL